MSKNIIRIIIGVALILSGYMLNAMAWDLYAYGLQPYRPLLKGEVSRVPRDEVGDYLGEPMEMRETDLVYQRCKTNSLYLRRLAFSVSWAGIFAFAIGALGIVAPPMLHLLVWLYLPGFKFRTTIGNPAHVIVSQETSDG